MKNNSPVSYIEILGKIYEYVKCEVTASGYSNEIAWQTSRNFEELSESDFLRESAWVILCSGFKESVIQKKFGYLSLCFCDWQEAKEIIANKEICRSTALKSFGHKGKINAILHTAEKVEKNGFIKLKQKIKDDPLSSLKQFPYIGEITAWHLAKNLGIPVAKPDRHLVRLANIIGYKDVQRLCGDIAEISGDTVDVVDIILWRYATLFRDLSIFDSLNRGTNEVYKIPSIIYLKN